VVVLPAISTFQRHGTQHLLHYWSPSSFHLVHVCRQLQRAYYLDFVRARAPRGVPSGFVQRTGCSACGLGHPHQVLVGSPHVHSSFLVPVSFAGFLIKCLRVYWQSLPHAALRGRFRAVWRVGFSSRCFPLCRSFRFSSAAHLRCDTAIPRRLFIFIFSISFSDLFHSSSPPPSGGGFRVWWLVLSCPLLRRSNLLLIPT
jgi:hypothetical protein